ncbi:hypothetical protein QTP88_022219 [Uroleucon formosanum]
MYSSRRYTPAIRCILAAALLLPISKPHTSCIYLPRSSSSSSSAAAAAAIYTAPAQRIVLSVSCRPSASARAGRPSAFALQQFIDGRALMVACVCMCLQGAYYLHAGTRFVTNLERCKHSYKFDENISFSMLVDYDCCTAVQQVKNSKRVFPIFIDPANRKFIAVERIKGILMRSRLCQNHGVVCARHEATAPADKMRKTIKKNFVLAKAPPSSSNDIVKMQEHSVKGFPKSSRVRDEKRGKEKKVYDVKINEDYAS